MAQGCVFNIQHYSVHDGPGIRTIIFLKGCHLRCQWCSNPESHQSAPEIAFNPDKCIGGECKICTNVCPDAITWDETKDRPVIDFSKSTECLEAAEMCPAKAINAYGHAMSVNEVLAEVEKDLAFYQRSEGGVTFSGGEPLMQRDFLLACLKECNNRRIHTCIETTGAMPWKEVEEIFARLDYILIDLKHIDSEKHKAWTGIDNTLTMENLIRIREQFPDKPMVVRTPVIPGFNDSPEEIKAIHDFVETHLPGVEHELLRYHRMGMNKYTFTGREYPLPTDAEITEDHFADLKTLVNQE